MVHNATRDRGAVLHFHGDRALIWVKDSKGKDRWQWIDTKGVNDKDQDKNNNDTPPLSGAGLGSGDADKPPLPAGLPPKP